MYYVYVIKSNLKDFMYVGYTSNLVRRLKSHNNGLSRSTKKYAPYILVYYEAYRSSADARDRERKLKHHGAVIGHLKRRIARSTQ